MTPLGALRDDRAYLLAGALALVAWAVLDVRTTPLVLATVGSDALQRAIAPGSLAE